MLHYFKIDCLFLLLTTVIVVVNSLDNGLARTPPMGWLTWERFRCIIDCERFPNDCINEALIKRITDAMVSNGYKDAGYEYVIVDDCWSEMSRNASGHLDADKKRFPNGMKYLGDYIHAKGLKFGIYQDYGTHTCGGYPGIIGYEEIDAQTFADWGVDYVKLDGCYSDINSMDKGYPNFGRLLNNTGRPMVYSCSWPVYQEENGIMPNFTLIMEHCSLWRNWDDIDDSWQSVKSITKYFAENQERIQPNAGPGHWNDPDMLIIGNFGLSIDQSRAQMAVWSILAAPLIMSTDLDTIRPEFKEILLNKEIIEVNQDRLGIQGLRISVKNNIEIWTRRLESLASPDKFDIAVAFVSLRTDGAPYPISIKLSDLNLDNPVGYTKINLFDKNQPQTKVMPSQILNLAVNPTGCIFYRFNSL